MHTDFNFHYSRGQIQSKDDVIWVILALKFQPMLDKLKPKRLDCALLGEVLLRSTLAPGPLQLQPLSLSFSLSLSSPLINTLK